MGAGGQTSDELFQRGLAAFNADDYGAALEIWEPLAEAGQADAQLGLGVIYLEGLGVAQDDALAARWFAQAAERGNTEAAYNLGFLYFSGRGVRQDLTAALDWFTIAADEGHAEANYYLGTMVGGGYGTQRDEVRAYAYFERAFSAARGDLKDLAARSRDTIGRRLSEAEIQQALELAQAAPEDPADASYETGLAAYQAGDYEQALAHWRVLAGAGDGLAQQGLGVLHHDGLGVPPDKGEAAKWFGRAAEQGFSESQYNLGLLLFAGDGVDQDLSAAARWFGLAGDQGHAAANYYLGTILAGGAAGVERDDEAAYQRFLMASRSDPEPSLAAPIRRGLESVARRLSPAQIARAEQGGTPNVETDGGDQLAELDTQLADARAAARSARDQLTSAEARAAQLADEAETGEAEVVAARSDLASVEQRLAELDEQVTAGEVQQDEQDAAVRVALERTATVEAALQESQQDVRAAAEARVVAERTIEDLERRLAAARSERQTAVQSETSAREDGDRLAAQLAAQQQSALTAQDELEQIGALLAEIQDNRERLAARRDAIAENLSTRESATEATKTAQAQVAAEIRAATAEAQSIEQRIAELESAEADAEAAAAAAAAEEQERVAAASEPPTEAPAPSPVGNETEIAAAQKLQEQAETTARDAPPPSQELVSAVQSSLGLLGYETGQPDGILGSKTIDAVRSFQAAQNLPPTGVITQELAFLLSLLAEREKQPPAINLALAGSGTGFVVADDGHILTNNHVVEACTEVRVQYGGDTHVADHVSSDTDVDLALLDGNFAADDYAVFRGGRGIRPGEDVVALGFPLQGRLSDQVKVTKGTISALSGPGNNRNLIQTTAPVQSGNSGGPLFDMSGNIVGVVVGKIVGVDVENVSFAINGSIARIFLDAEGVRYSTLRSDESLTAADVAEQGRRATVLIECWNPVG